MSTPRVSVVIPTFNRVQVVPGAVASVLAQTFTDFEIVVVVDGSEDGTADALRAAFDDPRLCVLEKKNGGLASARNAGVAAARGEYVALLDDDDRCLPTRLELQVRALDANPAAALCFADARYVPDDAGREADTLYGQPKYRLPDSLTAVFEGAWALPSVMMFRTSALRALGFDESIRYQEDTDFLFRFHRAGWGVIALPDILVHYTTVAGEGAGRISEQRARMDEGYAQVYLRHWDEVTPAERAGVRPPASVHRRLARYHLGRGDRALARREYLACWRGRPWRIRALLRGLGVLRPK